MQWNEIHTDWKEVSKKFQARWPELNDADLRAINGRREILIERLGKHYETDRNMLATHVEKFRKALTPVTA